MCQKCETCQRSCAIWIDAALTVRPVPPRADRDVGASVAATEPPPRVVGWIAAAVSAGATTAAVRTPATF